MTFPTGVETRKHSDEELTAILDEAREASKHAHKLGRVMGIVAARRIKQMREFLMYEELAIRRREIGFDRVAGGEESCFHGHRLLPPTPQEYYVGLWSVNSLKDEISMPRQKVSKLINAIEQGKLSDEECATLRRLVEKRNRKAAQITITPVDTVQYCSPICQTPEPPSVVYLNLENNEGEMDPELEELKSSSAGTGLKTPGQQCPPYEGIWEQGRTTASGISTAGAGSSKNRNISSSTERATSTVTVAGISLNAATASKRRHKTFNEEKKQFDGQGEKARLGSRLNSTFFSGENWDAPCCFLFVLLYVAALCVSVFFDFVFFLR